MGQRSAGIDSAIGRHARRERRAPNQIAYLWRDPRSSRAAPRPPAPIPAETGAVPADDGLRLDDDQRIFPTGPAVAQCDPEQAIQRPYGRPGALAFEHGELLSEGEDFQRRFSAREKENADTAKRARMKAITNEPL